jgi:subtilisin family serine protease
MKNFKIYLIGLFLLSPFFLIAQNLEFYSGKVRIIVNDPALIPKGQQASNNYEFNQLLSNFGITEITQPFDFAKTEKLKNLYELNTTFNEDSLFNSLVRMNTDNSLFYSIEKCPKPKAISDPADYMWWLTTNDPNNEWLWPLQKIQASLAWDITKGDTLVKVAITDNGIDPSHPDLIGKIYPQNNFYGGSPFNIESHGTSVATILAGETVDAGQVANGQMASIGYNTRIMFSSWSMSACVYASTVLGANIISLSWYNSCNPYPSNLLAEQEILNNGTTIIRAAGNGIDDCGGSPLYPFSGVEDSRTIIVSSVGKDDKHVNTQSCSGNITNSHYPQVDLCAPGYNIMGGTETTGSSWPYYGCWGGTSQSTPFVSGTAALMYAVNSCLNSNWTQDILKNTTDPIVDAQNFPNVVGTGRLNAYKAVKAAQGAYSPNLDLYIKDRPEDFGYSGSYVWGWWFDKSPDIWVRNQPDGLTNQTHQEPEYSSSQPVYVYVRVWNKSCDSSYAVGNLSLYWSKASTSSSWPQNWDGTQPNVGGQIASMPIPNLGPGESTIIEFEWNILNPYINQNWASCLLARIENISNDPITIYPNQLEYDVYNNNNVALRNVAVVDIQPGLALPNIGGQKYPHGRFMYIGNIHNTTEKYDVIFEIPKEIQSNSLIEEAEITITTDNRGWEILSNSISNNAGVKKIRENCFLIKNRRVILKDIEIPANTRIPIYVGFSFLIDKITSEEIYFYTVSQKVSESENHITGAEHFEIRKSPRNTFNANAGMDKEIHKNETTSIIAADISEQVIFNWYDPEGNLIQSDKNATISPEITTKYKLEVIANSDGFKDYDEVTITVKNFWINQISPNPADNQTSIVYNIENANSAYLMVMNDFGTVHNNYILPLNSTMHNIDVSNYTAGAYSVILVVNGIAVDSKNLIIN